MPKMEICLDCTFKVTGNAVIEVEADTLEEGKGKAIALVKAKPGLLEIDIDSLRSAGPEDIRAYDAQILEPEDA